MEDYKKRLGGLADKLKKEPPKTPVQEVQSVKQATPKEPEVQFNNRIPKALLKLVKAYGLEHEVSLQDINIQALEFYLKNYNKDK
ncbi:hypothetical protein LT679_01770 [Mucilaginibacter roseus]|uniref:Uncharacterized protein n=1 Tax=Mucilaginibacter roseus TaxID=1528868 RepID=A0ABS8TWQ7_9SPHI|nr:hypothetical protein [Mucilaginibacter roseus]MCD8739316.1 hypothetical protein [Mucilaginibacter roseus]